MFRERRVKNSDYIISCYKYFIVKNAITQEVEHPIANQAQCQRYQVRNQRTTHFHSSGISNFISQIEKQNPSKGSKPINQTYSSQP